MAIYPFMRYLKVQMQNLLRYAEPVTKQILYLPWVELLPILIEFLITSFAFEIVPTFAKGLNLLLYTVNTLNMRTNPSI